MGAGMRKAGENPVTLGGSASAKKIEKQRSEKRPLLYAHERGFRSESGPLAASAAEKVEIRAQEGLPSRNAQVRRPTAHRAGRAGASVPCLSMPQPVPSARWFAAVFLVGMKATGMPEIGGMYA